MIVIVLIFFGFVFISSAVAELIEAKRRTRHFKELLKILDSCLEKNKGEK